MIAGEDRLLTAKEAAKILSLSTSTLAKRRLRGLPPNYIKIGRAVRYSLHAVLEFVGGQRRSSTSQGRDGVGLGR